MLSFPSHMPSNGKSLPKRTDSLQRAASTADNAMLNSLQDEIHDVRRVQAYGQEEDLKEALGKMIGRVEELSSLLSQAYKSQNELETNLKLARSNLQLAIANNEMLEEALKRESASGSKDVGWRRWSENPNARAQRVVSEQVMEREKRRSGDSGRSTPVRRESGDQSSMSTPTTETSASTPGSPTPAAAQPSTSPPPQDNRFFRFRFGSSPGNASNARLSASASSSRPQTPPPRSRADELRERDAGHLTSVSLPSLVARTDKREEELLAELEAEKEKYAKVVKEKASLEQELEGLSQALFEEANKMVAHERIKCADIEEELRQIRQEKEALKSAMVIIEQENALLKTSTLGSQSPQSARSVASNLDLTPRSSRPNSRAGPTLVSSPPLVPESPDQHDTTSTASSAYSPPTSEPPSSSPASPEILSQPSVPVRKDSVPREQAWSPPDRYALPRSPVPELPAEDSPWAG